jgi:hypothetical protein
VSQAGEEVRLSGSGRDVARLGAAEGDVEWADLRSTLTWMREHKVLLSALVLIIAQLAWKSQFLGHLYFRQDDFHDLDLAVDHSFTWSYLTFIGSGHLIIGLRIVAWFMVRIGSTPYNWLLASVVSLAFAAAAGLAAYRALRDLFGERAAILVPLTIYLLIPLTMPDLGIWSSAMESVPLQLATFLAVSAHLRYVRTRGTLHLIAAAFWVAFGLLFFEKGLVVPLLLFGLTAAFLTDSRSVLGGVLTALRRFWLAWVLYLVLAVAYVAILAVALKTSTSQPKVPISSGGVITFVWELLRDTFLPGVLGGPWQWFPVSGNSFSFAAPPASLVAVSVVVVFAVLVVSTWLRPVAWRAWLLLASWIAVADVLPVVIGRLNTFNPSVLGLETRYVADATPVLVICMALAFIPLGPGITGPALLRSHARRMDTQRFRPAAAALVGVFVFSSIWSVQAYENVTNGTEAYGYITSARLALADAPKGTPVVDRPLPQDILEGTFEAYAYTSKVVGYMERGRLKDKLRWIGRPNGTVDGLMIFGADGRLHVAKVYGTASPGNLGQSCWPQHRGTIRVPFDHRSSGYSGALRIGYIWYSKVPGTVTVHYDHTSYPLPVKPGLHSGFLPIKGAAYKIVVSGLAGTHMCVGDVEAGNLGPASTGQVIPPLPKVTSHSGT